MAVRERLSPSILAPIDTSPSISHFFLTKSPSSSRSPFRAISSPSTPSARQCRSFFLPRSKARFLLLLLLLLIALLSLTVTSIAYLPPLDDYDLPQPTLESLQRSFEEVDWSLATNPNQPHLVGCPSQRINSSPSPGPLLLLLGVFSTADKAQRREFLRNQTRYKSDWPTDVSPFRTDFRFILGRPKGLISNWRVWKENRRFGDLVVVDCEENIDSGKTHAFLRWAAEGRRKKGWFWEVNGGGMDEDPRFVMKADDDTLLVAPNILAALGSMDCSKNIYFGTAAGATHYFERYFRGLGYALSWPLVKWIGSSDITPAHQTKIEDARTAQWLRHLDPAIDPVLYIDNGWTMVDYNQANISVETVALHFLKWDREFLEEQAKVRKIWSDAGKAYRPEEGVEWRKSVEAGRIQPEAAKLEYERQKAAGWDV